jgi:enoyl-[acyl-carrier protein] reductase III
VTDSFVLNGRTVLVTGGTRGIGRAVSLRFARAGATVVANYARNDAAASALQDEAAAEGLGMEVLRADLTLPKGLEAALARMARPVSGTLALVHCAATGVHRPIEELTGRHFDWTMALNVRVFLELLKALSPHWSDGSAIVALTSAGAERAVQSYAAVGASKGALESLARHAARELAPRGVRVNLVSPGSVATDAWSALPKREARLEEARRRTPRGQLVTPEEVAAVVHFLVSAASQGIIGQTIVVDGGARIVE